MIITSVEPQKESASRRTKRFNIYLDGEFAFGADEDLVVNRRLVPGKVLTTSDVEQILQETEVGKLMERMYRLFNIRQRSEKEIKDYLKNLSFHRKMKGKEELSIFIIDAIVQLLTRKGFLDDELFAKAWAESRSRKYGPQRIKQELFKKGIDREVIEEAISEKGKVISGRETAEILLEKKIRFWKDLDPLKFRKKAIEYLMRRGFEYDDIKQVVEKALELR